MVGVKYFVVVQNYNPEGGVHVMLLLQLPGDGVDLLASSLGVVVGVFQTFETH